MRKKKYLDERRAKAEVLKDTHLGRMEEAAASGEATPGVRGSRTNSFLSVELEIDDGPLQVIEVSYYLGEAFQAPAPPVYSFMYSGMVYRVTFDVGRVEEEAFRLTDEQAEIVFKRYKRELAEGLRLNWPGLAQQTLWADQTEPPRPDDPVGAD